MKAFLVHTYLPLNNIGFWMDLFCKWPRNDAKSPGITLPLVKPQTGVVNIEADEL